MAITIGARRNGKTARTIEAINERITAGEHVHIVTRFGLRCANGPAECLTERRTLAQLERELRR